MRQNFLYFRTLTSMKWHNLSLFFFKKNLKFSDIDLVLVGKWDQIPFDVVSKGIERKNLAKPGTLQLLEHATVSIIQ